MQKKKLLALDTGLEFRPCFDSVFRSLHNLKGAASMMELEKLQAHVHELETLLMTFKESTEMPKIYTNFFLKGIDAAREILNGKDIQFNYIVEVTSECDTSEKVKITLNTNNTSASFSQDRSVHSYTKGLLTSLGWNNVTDAFNGKEALELLEKKENIFSVVLLDWEMPILDGYKTLLEIRKLHKDLPIIIVTTKNNPENIHQMLIAGANEYMMKPFTIDILAEKIQTVTGKQSIHAG